MKNFLLTSTLVITVFFVQAQDRNWSVELNYPFSVDNGYFSNNDGAFDIGIKYRFLNTSLVHIGLDLNGGLVYDKAGRNNEDTYKSKTYIFQPKVFAEFDLPMVTKLHPMIGLGYTIVSNDISGTISGTDLSDRSGADGGFNFDVGLSYDISKKFFVQIKYDLILLQVKDEVIFDQERINIDFRENINRLKIGVGFRF
ncbi:outer membrane beta-barrel protein [Maribacter sp. CXY002]|uniref:outer membrane beta-barrel protein n=1 Tax=Maribacter luteocoastalis TaxID=3407671 RepID=UPI003B670BED